MRVARYLYLALPNTGQHDAVGVMERCVCDGTPCDETPTEMVGDGVSPRRVWVCGATPGLWGRVCSLAPVLSKLYILYLLLLLSL